VKLYSTIYNEIAIRLEIRHSITGLLGMQRRRPHASHGMSTASLLAEDPPREALWLVLVGREQVFTLNNLKPAN
jgi:hypothetical protein